MKTVESPFSRARIPYGTWGSSYFPAWQMSPIAEVNIGQFAGESMNRIMSLRGVSVQALEYMIIGSTIPWHYKFWTAPVVANCMGNRIPGFHAEQACATGLQAMVLGAAEVQGGGQDVVGVLTFDRTSDSPVGVFPERRSYERTQAIGDVWDNFGFDPSTGGAMINCAGAAARKYKLDRAEVDELSFHRYEQYFAARDSGWLAERICVPLELLNMQGRSMGVVDKDAGIRKITMPALRAMFEMDTCVTGGGQTHASDGMACMLVTTPERAKELSPRPEIDIQLLGKCEIRTQPGLMPEAPAMATGKLLERLGLTLDEISVIKTHNPFAVNDAIFAKVFDYDWRKMNNNGSSLVWGHPQGPTLTRLAIEGFEEAVDLGGGFVLLCGCAAGDVGIAAVFAVRDSEGGR